MVRNANVDLSFVFSWTTVQFIAFSFFFKIIFQISIAELKKRKRFIDASEKYEESNVDLCETLKYDVSQTADVTHCAKTNLDRLKNVRH